MEIAKQYRHYAEECRRLAEKAGPDDRVILMEIAEAWITRALRAEEQKERANVAAQAARTSTAE